MDNKTILSTIDDIMTLSDAAAYLKVAEKTLLRMIYRKEIPAAKVGSQYRFMKNVLEDWLIAKMKVVPADDVAKVIASKGEPPEIWRLMDEDLMVLDMQAEDRDSALKILTSPLADAGMIDDIKAFTDKLIARENIVSTAVDYGIALPHLRRPWENPAGRPVIVFGRQQKGLDFGAPDGKPTKLFFLICTDSEVLHLRALKQLAGIITDAKTRNALLHTETASEIIAVVRTAENSLKGEEK